MYDAEIVRLVKEVEVLKESKKKLEARNERNSERAMTEPRRHARRFAGIDIGTLTCRLLIADLAPGQPLQEVRSDRRILRLGEGVDQD